MFKKYICIPRRFFVINICNQGKFFAHPVYFNPLNAKLNPIYHLLALLGALPILHVSRIRVKAVINTVKYYKLEIDLSISPTFVS
jgi:hypothetical protein